MSDPSEELQNSFVDLLKRNSAVADIVDGAIYDGVPTTTNFPYVSFGSVQVLPNQGDLYDGAECHITLDIWTKSKTNFIACKKLGSAVQAAISQAVITLPSHRVMDIRIQSTLYMRDPDGITRHGVLIFKALTEPSDS